MASAGPTTILGHVRKLVAAGALGGLADDELLHKFAADHDEAAFATLVQRHGAMVLGVCRRLVANTHDAEDAFQAAFMVLARKAGARHWQPSIGGWLYAVAYRVASRIRVNARRLPLASRMSLRAAKDPLSEITGRELLQVLDEELNRLPEKYRTPLVLCYLQEATRDEAARRLGCPLGTLKSRLERGREILRRRLGARGVALPMTMLATVLSAEQIGAALPSSLVSGSVRAAVSFASGSTNTAAASAQATLLAHGVLRGFLVAKWQAGVLLALLFSVLAVGAGWGLHEGLGTNPPLAQASTEPQNPPRALVVPAEDRQQRFDLFGDPLPPEALARLGTVRFRPGSHITSLAFTADGKKLAANVWGGLRLWEAATGKELSRFPAKGLPETCAASPDGKLAAVLVRDGNDYDLSLCELAGGRQVCVLGKTGGQHLCFSPDGKTLVTYGSSQTEVWDVPAGKRRHSWKHEPYLHAGTRWAGSVECAVFTTDGKTLVTAGNDKAIRFWDVATGKQTHQIAGPPNVIQKLALSPDGKLVASNGSTLILDGVRIDSRTDSFVRIWDVTAGKEVRQLSPPAGETDTKYPRPFNAMAFSPDGRTLVTGGLASGLRVWDPIHGRELRQLARDCGNPWAMTFSPDGNTLAVAAGGQSIRLFDWRTGKDLFPMSGHQNSIKSTVVSADGNSVATISYERTILVWDAVTGRQRYRLDGHEQMVTSLRLGGDGHTLLSTGMDKTLRSWDLATGRELRKLGPFGDFPNVVAVSPDDRLAAIRAPDDTVALLDLVSGKELKRLSGKSTSIDGGAFTPDGRTLIAWTSDGVVHLWNAMTGQKLRQIPFPPEPDVPQPPGPPSSTYYTAALSPDAKLMAYGQRIDPALVLQEVATGKEVHRLANLPDSGGPMAFSRDGRTLAWGGSSGFIGLVEVATGRQRYEFPGRHGDGVTSLTFSADGTKLIAGNDDTTALVWDLTGRVAMKPGSFARLSSAELAAAWADLANQDAARAYQTIKKLAAVPAEAIPYLGKRLKPAAVVGPERLAQLIRDLGSNSFAVRERATQELQNLADQAGAACRQALKDSPSEESRRRLEKVLARQWQAFFNPEGERLRELRALEVLELTGTAEAGQIFQRLATGAADARLTWEAKASLERLGRRAHVRP
jgi:RNA polymerase sigma factor (sigma-70 family)